ncbi:hypothetical protein ACH4F6_13500 [Streptomyces sp. NPDC017936]|uniref:hypothetical protein n=1 Tax=Streptomyces sp. NPDC017936 TaxID=3365016 RepID=UPI0037897617
MRKLRKAALVTAMIGSLSMAAAGAASATDYGKDGKDQPGFCVNNNETDASVSGLIPILNNVNLSLLGGSAPVNATQQSCVVGDNSFSGNHGEIESDNDLLDLI